MLHECVFDQRIPLASGSVEFDLAVPAHLAADHLAPYAERLCAPRAVESLNYGTNTAQA